MILVLIISLPIAAALLAWVIPSNRLRPLVLPIAAALHLALVLQAVRGGPVSIAGGWLVLDPLVAPILLTVSVLFLCLSLYAPGYLRLRRNRPNRVFCACLLLLLGMMSLVLFAHHLGLMWVAIEATTLASGPLLYFNQTPRSLEAAWKYLLICSVGIALALMGSFFLAYSALQGGLNSTLLFDDLVASAGSLSHPWLHAAFVTLLVGYGTKMGLAPMHTWKPDAYGEAPGIVGALLAGGVTNCGFIAILRFTMITEAAGESAFVQNTLIGMGLLSMAFAAVFMVRQKDFKRMLAYSSVEHMGILIFGIGIGGIAVFGSLLHVINNSLVKGVLFLSSGNIHRAYGSKLTDEVTGALQRLPASAALFLAGFIAITGSPPFGPFVSEFTILRGAFEAHRIVPAALYLLLPPHDLHRDGLDRARRRPGHPVGPSLVLHGLQGHSANGAPDPPPAPPRPPPGVVHSSASLRDARECRGLSGEEDPLNDPRPELATLHNGDAIRLERLPRIEVEGLRGAVIEGVQNGMRVASLFAMDSEDGRSCELLAILVDDLNGEILAGRTTLARAGYPSMTPECLQAHLFEREIWEQFGVVPVGHPWLKPVRFAPPMSPRPPGEPGKDVPLIGVMDFYHLDGEEVHEVAVGPVHAGVIEPGHFRFQCHGEQVFHLEISLGYQHRGVEEALLEGPHKLSLRQMETTAGDSTIAHAWAYCQNLEALAAAAGSVLVPARAHVLRSIALELERLANHAGDLGALAGDVGYLPTMSYCGRIRGDFLNMTAVLCGNRFGRDFVRPGRTGFDLEAHHVEDLLQRLEAARTDVTRAVELLWATPSVMARFENTGPVSRETCLELGLVGPSARACGIERDVRNDHPTGVYRFAHIPVSTADGGDVNSRAFVRWLEIQRSIAFIRERLQSLPGDGAGAERSNGARFALAPRSLAVSLVEGWRGEVCHVAVTDNAGRFARYKITDPSFHNWMGLAMALRDQQISDFPLTNKSFNLSYCGHDL